MKTIQINEHGGSEVLKYKDVEMPKIGDDQVLVKVKSISINYADVMIRAGIYPNLPPFPITPGVECSGIIEESGSNINHLEKGQKVLVFGQACYSEYVVADANSAMPLPDNVDFDEVAALPVNYLTAYHMLHTMAKIEKGQTVLLHAAAGGVGTAVIQLSKLAGIKVIGLTSSEEKMEYAKSHGIDHIINYKKENVVERVNGLTNGKGVNLILDSVAGKEFERNFDMLAPLGQIILFGTAAGMPEIDLLAKLFSDFSKSAGVRFFGLYAIPNLDANLMVSSMQKMVQYLAEGKIKPHIYEKIPLSDASRAHELLESQKVVGKLVLNP